jgi:Cys-tRNA synthase (O-phospho-L-seryl-tRNA:Cys-tRNA synthase)
MAHVDLGIHKAKLNAAIELDSKKVYEVKDEDTASYEVNIDYKTVVIIKSLEEEGEEAKDAKVTFKVGKYWRNIYGDLVVEIEPEKSVIVGPFESAQFGDLDDDGLQVINLEVEDADVEITIIQLP